MMHSLMSRGQTGRRSAHRAGFIPHTLGNKTIEEKLNAQDVSNTDQQIMNNTFVLPVFASTRTSR